MADASVPTTPMTFTLSRHELLVILDTLNADTIPGLEEDPLGPLDEAQERLARTIAQRALVARGYLRWGDNEPVLLRWVGDAVATCIRAPEMLMIYHRPPAAAPIQYYVHIIDGRAVVHIPSQQVLHFFSIQPSRNDLLDRIDDIVNIPADLPGGQTKYILPEATFIQAREQAQAGQLQAAQQTLEQAHLPSNRAAAFLATLTRNPALTVFQHLKAISADETQKADFTVIRDDQSAWLLTLQQEQMELRPVNRSDFREFMMQVLGG